jgi:hypothetical protein
VGVSVGLRPFRHVSASREGGVTKLPSIFVSYRRTDAPGHAGRLYDRFVDRFGEANVFKDLDSMEPGADFVEVIEETVARCDALIAVIGQSWLGAERDGARRLDDPQDWVRLEIGNALTRSIRVVPVLVHGATMPREADLPKDLQGLARRHAVELSESAWTAQVDGLIERLQTPRQSGASSGDAMSQQAPPATTDHTDHATAPAPGPRGAPRDGDIERVAVGDEFRHATVVKTTTFGAFIELTEGVHGLLHIYNIAPGRRPATVEEVFNTGDDVDVVVVETIPERGRIGLRLADDPAVAGKSLEELADLDTPGPINRRRSRWRGTPKSGGGSRD